MEYEGKTRGLAIHPLDFGSSDANSWPGLAY